MLALARLEVRERGFDQVVEPREALLGESQAARIAVEHEQREASEVGRVDRALQIRRVAHAEHREQRDEQVAHALESFDRHPPGARDEYWVVDYVEPLGGNEPAFGLDLRTRVAVGAAERARDSGEPEMTGRYRLVQETGTSFGLVIYLPVYGIPEPLSEAARREALKGFVGVVLRVDDNGPGIPPGDLHRVFDPFYRAGRTDRVAAGSGLGLAICRGLAAAMGGRIMAESPVQDGRGTRMTLWFPT